jgi:pimeloyl-ACP methyl ester carboxylesterase
MTTIFTSPAAKETLDAFYERFRAHVPEARGRWVPTRFGETHVLVAGRPEAPPLLLLHGALTGAAHMMSASAAFLDHFRVYAPDIPGQSAKSIDVRLDYDGSSCGEWLTDVMDAVGVERAHVSGASLGGFMARKLAEHAPERIDHLVLNVPAGIVTASPFAIVSDFIIPKLIYRAFPRRDRLLRIMSKLMTSLDETPQDEEWVEYFDAAFRSFCLDLRMPPLGTPEALARFRRPTLVFGASHDRFFPGAALLERAKALFPHAETELLGDCSHVLPSDDAFKVRYRARVERFLGIEASVARAA